MTDKTRLEDIARQAGVSIASVSRYLNGIKVRNENAKRIVAALQKMEFQKRAIATKNAVDRNNDIIGMIVPDIKHNYCSKIVSGAIIEAR